MRANAAVDQSAVYHTILRESESAISILGTTLPELNYMAFSTYTLLAPLLLSTISQQLATLLPQAPGVVGPVWNYVDAASSGLLGAYQLFERENHRRFETKLKGGINLASALQLTAFTAINFPAFGPASFAAAFFFAFVNSLEDSVYYARRRCDFTFWLEDNFAELDHLNQLIAEKEGQQLEKNKELQKSRIGRWIVDCQKEHLDELKARKAELESDIKARIMYRKSSECPIKDKDLISIDRVLNRAKRASHVETRGFAVEMIFATPLANEKYQEKENAVIKKCNDQLKASISNTVLYAMAFSGMALLCAPAPGPQVVGAILVGAASALFLYKNRDKVIAGLKSIGRGFASAGSIVKNSLFSERNASPATPVMPLMPVPLPTITV